MNNKKKFEFSGRSGLVVLLAAICFAFFQLANLSDITDEALKRDLKLRLTESTDGKFLEELKKAKERGDYSSMTDATENFENPVTFYRIEASASLLKWSNNRKVIVRVDYSLNEQSQRKRQTKYFRYINRLLGVWEYQGSSNALSYYLNFL
jgi:hypothetical protein